MGTFIPNLAAMLNSDMPFRDYVPVLIETVIDTMIEQPQIPIFVLQELSSNPERMPQIIKEMGIDPSVAIKKMTDDGQVQVLMGMDPRQVILNILSLCIFPFAARPVVTEILYQGSDKAYIKAMEERKKQIPQIVKQIMK
jgi:hypothetical protein